MNHCTTMKALCNNLFKVPSTVKKKKKKNTYWDKEDQVPACMQFICEWRREAVTKSSEK